MSEPPTKEELFNSAAALHVPATDDNNGVHATVRPDRSVVDVSDDMETLVWTVSEARAVFDWLNKVLP